MSGLNRFREFAHSLLKKIDDFVTHNLKEVIIVIGVFTGIIIVGTILFSAILSSGKSKKNPLVIEETRETPVEQSLNYDQLDYLLKDSVAYPHLKSFDVTMDYIDFMPLKADYQPDKEAFQYELDQLIQVTLEESCKFNFEKRRGK
ncbi:MAG: hypothetical protein MJB14_12565 [Spirochaetes bacterium]|nr:hypothetical protein [Spirochaetota bacterium]